MARIPALKDMLKAGVHFGHRTSRWHPKMAQYIFGVRSGIHIIDVEQTYAMLESILKKVEDIAARGGTVMFIGTKPQAQSIVAQFAKEAGMPHVTERWLGGTFTNFSEIQKLIKQYLDLMDKREKGELKKYTKLEQLQFDRKIEELDKKIGGMSTMKDLPDAVFVVDVRYDKTAVMEARKRGVSVIGIVDTNVNPDLVDYVIPANDDSVASITLMCRLVAQAIQDGKQNAKRVAAEVKAAQTKAQEDLQVKAADVETVEELDDVIKEELAKQTIEEKK